jgi:hypothetical protein
LATGSTLKTSAPLGVPFNGIPRVYTLLLFEKLLGVEADKVATPPVYQKAVAFILLEYH